eukprot:CAMPEP_0182428538 /NCGR_PEP_ID=MMETSP1167-20130531/23099_1 /TAXON_ID=2988 /ORGANISM="Mallomonas Sp, Strain CCMP3275" /LENGTH=132 /DNA_ID=CAMNT_0024611495 /DNA_START=225 /DNA_END=623 /DNA_ORIENTATION=-
MQKKPATLPTISISDLQQHNSQFDAWVSYKGKVYNITQYLDYHPGGLKILLDVAGKDCTALVLKYHKWVNVEQLLAACHIGNLPDELQNDDDEYIPENDIEELVPITCSPSLSTDIAAKAMALLSLESSDDL